MEKGRPLLGVGSAIPPGPLHRWERSEESQGLWAAGTEEAKTVEGALELMVVTEAARQEVAPSVTLEVSGWAVSAFIGYLLVLVAIGAYSSRFSSEGISEFFVGGRKMKRLVVALSAVVSGRSAWLLLGVTGMAYATGASALWAVTGYTVVECFLFLFYARRLRRFSEVHDCITVPDFFAARFGDEDGGLRVTLAGILLVFMVSYVSAQFVAGGKAIGASFGLGPTAGILLTALIVLLYTTVGGFLAVSLTDTLQGFLMLFALLGLPLVTIPAAGGWEAVISQLTAYEPGFVDPLNLGLGAFLGLVGIGLGSPGNPHIVIRYMSIDDADQLPWVAGVGTLWNVLMGAGAVLIGLVGRIYVPEVSLLPAADTENLFPVLAHQHLHPALFGVVVASIFAAIMSTADSQLLVAASTLVRDVYQRVLRAGEEISDRRLMFLSRGLVVVLVGVALAFGLLAEDLVFWLVLFAWAGLGAALGPTSILALYWKGTTRAGIFAGLIVGTVTTIVWYLTPALKEFLYELIPAFVLSLAVTVVVSLGTRAPDDVEELFGHMERPDDGTADPA